MWGLKLHPSGLAFARKRLPPGIELVQMDAREIPALDLFDLMGAFDVIEHIADDEAVLRGMRAAMRRGGGVILAVPQHPWLWSLADEMAYHERRYRVGELEIKLRRNGFEDSFFDLLYCIVAAADDGKTRDGQWKANPRRCRSRIYACVARTGCLNPFC